MAATDYDHALWEAVRNQGQEIIALSANQSAIKDSLAQIAATLKGLTEQVNSSHRTQWPVIFGTMTAATAFLTIIGGVVAYAWIGDITDVGKRVDQLSEQTNHHIALEGHPDSVIKQIQELKEASRLANQRLTERLNRMDDQMNYLERRTGVLFNKGEPY